MFREAKANCFPKELSRFDVLLEEVRDVTESLTRLANDGIADLVATKIPQAATYEMQNTMAEWTSPFGLVVACVEMGPHRQGAICLRDLCMSLIQSRSIPISNGVTPELKEL